MDEDYDQTEPSEHDKYGNVTDDVNMDAENNRFWITKKLSQKKNGISKSMATKAHWPVQS